MAMKLCTPAILLDGINKMRKTMDLAHTNPNLTLKDRHSLTTDQQNLIELLSAAEVMVSHMGVVAIPPEMEAARDRLAAAIRPVNIAPKKGRD